MKRVLILLLVFLILCGCGRNNELDRAMLLRDQLLQSSGCEFDCVIAADYGENVYTFSMHCLFDEQGNMTFTVTEPETIRNITGIISADDGGKLTFDEHVLVFPLIADGQVTPVSVPFLFIKALRSGYLTSCGKSGEYMMLSVNDSYASDALCLDIWLNQTGSPVLAEVLWRGYRILSLEVKNFVIL